MDCREKITKTESSLFVICFLSNKDFFSVFFLTLISFIHSFFHRADELFIARYKQRGYKGARVENIGIHMATLKGIVLDLGYETKVST